MGTREMLKDASGHNRATTHAPFIFRRLLAGTIQAQAQRFHSTPASTTTWTLDHGTYSYTS